MPCRRSIAGSLESLDALNRSVPSQPAACAACLSPLIWDEEPKPRPDPVLLTVAEFAAKLRMSEKSVRRRIKAGTIRKASLGGRAVRISPDELRRLTAGTPLEEASEDPEIA